MGVKGPFKNMETSPRSLTGVFSLIGSRAVIRRPEDDLGFSTISEVEGAKRPLKMTNKGTRNVITNFRRTLEARLGVEDFFSAFQINRQRLDRPPTRPDYCQGVS